MAKVTNIELQAEVISLKEEIKQYKQEVESLRFSISGLQSLIAKYVEDNKNGK